MNVIDSTAEFVASVYQQMERNLEVVRGRLNRPLTLAEKVVLGHLDDPNTTELERGQSYVQLRPDRVVLQDVLGQTGRLISGASLYNKAHLFAINRNPSCTASDRLFF